MEKYRFYKTNVLFNNFKSFNNHVRSYSKKNNLNLNQLLQENYDIVTNLKSKFCIHCGLECPYNGYLKGYRNPCHEKSCYKNYVNKNINYYSNQLHKKFFDPYDSKNYGCAFTKRYYDIVNESILENANFYVDRNCIVCNKLMQHTSIFSDKIQNKTCSESCKFKHISSKTRSNSVGVIFSYNPLQSENFRVKINHFIYTHKKYPKENNFDTNKFLLEKYKTYPELKLPGENSKIHYSKKYDLYFYKNLENYKNNTLYEYLDSSHEKYLNYHIENKLGKTNCPGCNKNILFIDVFGSILINRTFCTKECYYNSLRGRKVPDIYKRKQSEKMKLLISEGLFTPTITNSWCRSKTKVIIKGEEKFVRSSWEALFWLLNQDLEYEKIRIPYMSSLNKNRVYITDFYCPKESIIYEIKPNCKINDINNINKLNAALEYCNHHNLTYKIIDENYFIKMYQTIDRNYLLKNLDNRVVMNIDKSFGGQAAKCPPTAP